MGDPLTFASDNWAGASDKVMGVLAEANRGIAPAYGNDEWTERARGLLNEVFEREVAAYFVSTGSAANAIALASFAGPGAVTLCHIDAHIARDEAGAPGLFAPGMVLDPLDGEAGRLTPEGVSDALAEYPQGVVHHGRPTAISLTNVNELGQCYGAPQIAEIAEIARSRGLAVHVDGARFMNALAHTGRSAADLTWRAGVDVLSLGLTKTGGWCAEAVVYFDPARANEAAYRHKQAAQLLSKNRFAAAQFVALLGDGHALALAEHANRMAGSLAEVLDASPEAALLHQPQSNEVFAFLAPTACEGLAAAGITAYPWAARSKHMPAVPHANWVLSRFVVSYRVEESDVAHVAAALGGQ